MSLTICDGAGNLLNDGTTTYGYDALNRQTTTGATTNRYNGDGTLVEQINGGVSTRSTQDLVAPLSQVLQTITGGTTTHYAYGCERLFALSASTRTCYASDALGSVRRALSDEVLKILQTH